MSKNNKSILGYKQNPGCKRWEVLPGLTLDAVEKVTQPMKNGQNDGSRNYPPAGSHELSETEQRIVFEAENHLTSVDDLANKEMTDINRQVRSLSLENVKDPFSELKAGADKGFQRYALNVLPELKRLRVAEREGLRNLKLFKAKNHLERLASYPDSMWFHVSLVCLCMLAECFANMYYFAAGSELGFLGGFFQALGVSVANVGLSTACGRLALSNLHHINKARVSLAALFVCLWVVLISFYHILVAHYRDLLFIDPNNAILKTLDKFREAPFHFESFESIVVLVIGLLIAIFALIEGYRFDDPYPGFGNVDRNYRKKVLEYEAKEAELRDKMSSSIVQAEYQIDERLKVYEAQDKEMTDLVNGAVSVVEHFDSFYRGVDDIVTTLISKYREANKRIRTEADPLSFAQIPTVKRVLQKEQYHHKIKVLQASKEASSRQLKNIQDNAAKALAKLSEKTESMLERIDGIADDIDKRADEEVTRLIQEV